MGILTRFKDIISSNINAMLDKAEDPQKMIEQYLRQLTQDLADVKRETAAVMAEEVKAKRNLETNRNEIARYTSLAKAALAAGNENDAKVFIKKKQSLEEVGASLQQVYDVSVSNTAKMRQMHDKLRSDLGELQQRKEMIEQKLKVAKAQEKVNKAMEASAANRAEASLNAFARMEDKVNKMLDEANAMADLNLETAMTQTAAAELRYQEAVLNTKVDDELAAMKMELGLL